MSGQLPQSDASEGELHFGVHHLGRRHRRKEPSVEIAATSFFTGIGFIVAAIAILLYAPAGAFWWWPFMIPAFATIGQGVGQYLRWRELQRKQALLARPGNQPVDYQSISQAISQAPAQVATLSAPTTSELVKPSSVTEHTTRHLE